MKFGVIYTGIISFGMAVIDAVGAANGKAFAIEEDKCGIHVVGFITDFDLLGDKLHGNVVGIGINGDGGILTHLSGNAV